MGANIILTSTISLGLMGILSWILKKWIGTKIEAAYEQKSDSLRATIQRDHEASLITFKNQLEEQARLQSSAFSSFAAAQQASVERRLDAVETIWADLLAFRSDLPSVFEYLDILTVEEMAEASNHPSGQELFGELSEETLRTLIASHGLDGGMWRKKDYTLERVRPYVNDYLWGTFVMYKKIMFRVWLHLVWFKTKGGDHIYWYNHPHTRRLIEAVLTADELADFDKSSMGKIEWLRFRLEQKVVAELRRIISGEVLGSKSLQQARKYQQLAGEGLWTLPD